MNALSGIITSVANRVTESDDQEKVYDFNTITIRKKK